MTSVGVSSVAEVLSSTAFGKLLLLVNLLHMGILQILDSYYQVENLNQLPCGISCGSVSLMHSC